MSGILLALLNMCTKNLSGIALIVSDPDSSH